MSLCKKMHCDTCDVTVEASNNLGVERVSSFASAHRGHKVRAYVFNDESQAWDWDDVVSVERVNDEKTAERDFVVLTDDESDELLELIGVELGMPSIAYPQRHIATGALKAIVHVLQSSGWRVERPRRST